MGKPKPKKEESTEEKGGGGSNQKEEDRMEEWPQEEDEETMIAENTAIILHHTEEMNLPLPRKANRRKRNPENDDFDEKEVQFLEKEREHQALDDEGLIPAKKRISHGSPTTNSGKQVVIWAKKLKMSESESAFWKQSGEEHNTFFYQPPQASPDQPIRASHPDTKTRKKLFTFRSGLPKLEKSKHSENGLRFGFHASGPLVDELHFESGLPKELQQRMELDQSPSVDAGVAGKSLPEDLPSTSNSSYPAALGTSTQAPLLGNDSGSSRGCHSWSDFSSFPSSNELRLSQSDHPPNTGTSTHHQATIFVAELPYGSAPIPSSSNSSVPTTFSFVNIDVEFLMSPKKAVTSPTIGMSASGGPGDGAEVVEHSAASTERAMTKPRTSSPFGTTRGRRKSPIWAHFVLQNDKYVCKLCKSATAFSYSVTTRTLKKHIVSYHPDVAVIEPCLQETLAQEERASLDPTEAGSPPSPSVVGNSTVLPPTNSSLSLSFASPEVSSSSISNRRIPKTHATLGTLPRLDHPDNLLSTQHPELLRSSEQDIEEGDDPLLDDPSKHQAADGVETDLEQDYVDSDQHLPHRHHHHHHQHSLSDDLQPLHSLQGDDR